MMKPNEQEGIKALTPGTLVDGRYKVARFIGQGGSGAVYEVEHTLTGRKLAMKCLLDEASYGRLEQEARAASLMKNTHSVRITDMGRTGPGGPYLVMELLEGQSLRTLLEETGQLPLALTVNIALQVCECVAEAHAHGLIHRDLKPENIFLCEGATAGQPDVKVLDFGVVKIASDGPIPNSSLTRTGSTVGTPYYMSLEQLRNSSNVDARADIYALGVLLYESLSGTKPYQAETLGDLVYALAVGPPPPLQRIRPDLPGPLCDVIMRALSSNREQRPGSMIELAEQLLPHGDAALGVWLRTRAAAASATRPAKKDAPAPPSPKLAKPAAAGKMSLTAPFPTSVDAKVPEHTSSRGDRDTPTEMYVKALHDKPDPETAPIRAQLPAPPELDEDDDVPRRDTPTQAFDTSRVGGQAAPSLDESTSDLPKVPRAATVHGLGFQATQPAQERMDVAALAHAEGYPSPGVPEGPPPPAPEGYASSAPLLAPPPVPPQMAFAPTVPHPGYVTGSGPGGARPKPAWEVSLDRALLGVGDFLERNARSTGRSFRAASPKAQIALVMGGASLCAALLILVLYLIVR